LRRTARAGFLGSNFAALNPCPVIRLSDDPSRTVSRYLKDRRFPLLRGRGTSNQRIAACHRLAQRARMQFHGSSRTPMKIILCLDCGTPQCVPFDRKSRRLRWYA
jgi:hypothetical protein